MYSQGSAGSAVGAPRNAMLTPDASARTTVPAMKLIRVAASGELRTLSQTAVGRRLPRDADARRERQQQHPHGRGGEHIARERDADRGEREQTAENPSGRHRDDSGRTEPDPIEHEAVQGLPRHHSDGEERDAENTGREPLGWRP
jgi:hypothetical protein